MLMPKLSVHVQTRKKMFDRNQRVKAMNGKITDARSRLGRINQITYQSMQSTGNIVLGGSDDALVQQPQPVAVSEAAGTAATSPELQSTSAIQPREMFEPVSLPPAFALPPVVALHSAPHSRVHTSTIGEVPPVPPTKRSVRKDKGKKHKLTTLRKPRRCLVCVQNNGPNIYTCNGRTPRGACEFFGTTLFS